MEIIYFRFLNLIENPHPLVYMGLLLLLSYVGGKLANLLKAPRVSGYLVTGMILSPSVLGLFQEKLVEEELALITDIALAIIAFSIGGGLGLAKMRKLGRHILWITSIESLGAFIVVTMFISLFFYLLHGSGTISSPFWEIYFPMALVIGAMSAATAPAATMAIIHEYRAKGPLTTILLGVVALDDGMAILLFAFAITIENDLVFVQHGLIAESPPAFMRSRPDQPELLASRKVMGGHDNLVADAEGHINPLPIGSRRARGITVLLMEFLQRSLYNGPLPENLSAITVQAEQHTLLCLRKSSDGKNAIAPDDR